jgi:RNA polymerase sigma-70 factor, ECF subfamily
MTIAVATPGAVRRGYGDHHEPAEGATMPGSAEFTQAADPYRRELLAHCYRMLGSVHEAEDLVQETYLRAWRAYPGFDQGRASLRTWLYRIATNACLTALAGARRRPLPSGLGAPSEDPGLPLARGPEIPWLEPVPDALIDAGPSGRGDPADPASIVSSRAGIRLAFIAALQYLPARQRAVLILRDVLGFHAAEVAELLGTTAPAVNSALQRAHAQLERVAPAEDQLAEPPQPRQRELLDRYVTAFEAGDVAGLGRLLADDIALDMPPYLTWFAGRRTVTAFLAQVLPLGAGARRTIRVTANGQPAIAAYRRGADGRLRAHSVHVLTLSPAGIQRISVFLDPGLFGFFGLPPEPPAQEPPAQEPQA